MSLTITEVSGGQAAVCEVEAGNGAVRAGCWIGNGVPSAGNQKIQLNGWINPPTMVQVWTAKGSCNIAYRADEANKTYVVQQSAGAGGPETLWEGPIATTNLALTVNDDGSLTMTAA